MNLWTVPASDQASLLNIPKSLSGSVDPTVLAAFGLPSPLYAWGARIGTNNTANVLERMKPGDVCLSVLSGSLEGWARSLDPSGQQPIHEVIQQTPSLPPPPPPISPIEVTNYFYQFANSRAFRFGISSIRRLLASIKAKPFVILAGNSGTGKSRLVRLFAEASGATVENGRFTMIPVRPDWNDSSELLGYFDLNGDYVPGQLITP
jgi:hypothetical protein